MLSFAIKALAQMKLVLILVTGNCSVWGEDARSCYIVIVPASKLLLSIVDPFFSSFTIGIKWADCDNVAGNLGHALAEPLRILSFKAADGWVWMRMSSGNISSCVFLEDKAKDDDYDTDGKV